MPRRELHNLNGLLDGISEQTNGEETTVGEVLGSFGSRSYGPLLFLPGFLAAAPTGAIPGVATGMAALIVLFSLQMIFSPGSLWVPKRIKRIELKSNVIDRTLNASRPIARFIDKVLAPRIDWLFQTPLITLVAAISLAMGLLMFPFAFVPFAATLPGAAVALFGLALTSEDGIMLLAAAAVSLGSVALGLYLLVGF